MQNQPNMPRPQNATGESRVSGQASSLADKAEKAVEHAKDAAIERAHTVRQQAKSEIEQTRNQVAERIRSVSSALRSAGDNLRDENEFVARYMDRAGDGVEKAATYITSATPREVVRDVEQFARERPAWFFGGAFLVGLAAARFLKASASATGELSGARERSAVSKQGYDPLVPYVQKDIGP